MGWDAIGWDAMGHGCDVIRWVQWDAIECDGLRMRCDEMGCDGMGMRYDGMRREAT